MGTLLAEIAEQPQVLARLLESELDAADAVAQAMRDHNVELVLFAEYVPEIVETLPATLLLNNIPYAAAFVNGGVALLSTETVAVLCRRSRRSSRSSCSLALSTHRCS